MTKSKAVMMTIRSKGVEKILKGEKTTELRKNFPKDFTGWIYIYCTKGRPYLNYEYGTDSPEDYKGCWHIYTANKSSDCSNIVNGQIVGRFYCGLVEPAYYTHYTESYEGSSEYDNEYFDTDWLNRYELSEAACLSEDEIKDYFDSKKGFAVHISKVEKFDTPKNLRDFGLTKAPSNWCHIKEFKKLEEEE